LNELVSIIIPTYKRSYNVLIKAIRSVLNQTYTNIEIIIVNDNPKMQQYRNEIRTKIDKINDNRLVYIEHEKNQGACAARNTGIKHSQGKYVAFLDDDDEWMVNKVELQLTKFKDPDVGLVYCDSHTIIVKNEKVIDKKVRANRFSGWVYDELIIDNFIGSTSFVMLKKEVLNKCGYFDKNLRSAQDFELWLRISRLYKVNYVSEILVNYYMHDGERISTNVNNKISGLESLINLNIDYLRVNPKAHCIRKLKILPFYARRDGFKKALLKWMEAIKLYPYQLINLKYLMKIFKVKIQSINIG